MKKILVFLVMLSLMSVMGMFAISGVLAVDQGINVTISENITILITPSVVQFGAVLPGSSDNDAVENVSFDATGSNVDVSVEVTTVSGEPFTTGLKFDGTLAQGESYVLPCVLSGELCTYDLKTVDTTLDVPATFKKGTYPGTITYTITEAP